MSESGFVAACREGMVYNIRHIDMSQVSDEDLAIGANILVENGRMATFNCLLTKVSGKQLEICNDVYDNRDKIQERKNLINNIIMNEPINDYIIKHFNDID